MSLDAPARAIWVFDENLIPTSPAGSCLLKVVDTVAGVIPLRLFFNRLELRDAPQLRKTRIPLPPGPIFLRAVLFALCCGCFYFGARRKEKLFRMSTQGVFPFCDLSYAHFCHRGFLNNHRDSLSGSFLRRTARLLNHRWHAFTEGIAFKSARAIVVPSEGLARDIQATYPALVSGKIHVIANPVDIEFYSKPADFQKKARRDQLGFSEPDLLLCFCALGNFEHKGLQLIFQALAQDAGGTIKLLVVGGSPAEIREFERRSLKLGLGKRVRFVGFQRNIREYLWASDAFVLPSLSEVFPLVCLQAAAAGLPLITTKLYGVEEFMLDGVTGWTVEREPAAIDAAFQRADSDRPSLARMGRQARERVLAYSEERFRSRWKELLESELQRRFTCARIR